MSFAATSIRPVIPTDVVYPLTVDQYHEMIRVGVIDEDSPVELVEGILVFKTGKNPPHSRCMGRLNAQISSRLPATYYWRIQEPITLGDGEPEPDGAVVRGGPDDFGERHPGGGDVPLVVEVSDSSLSKDRGSKLRSYARAGISTYWIVNLESQVVEVYTRPDAAPQEPKYLDRTDFRKGDAIPLHFDGLTLPPLAVADVLPSS